MLNDRCYCCQMLFKSTEPIQKQPRSALCFSLWWLSEPQCVFCIHKKTFCLIDTQLSFYPWSACLFASHKACKNSTERRENLHEKHLNEHFLLKLAFLDLRVALNVKPSSQVHFEENTESCFSDHAVYEFCSWMQLNHYSFILCVCFIHCDSSFFGI